MSVPCPYGFLKISFTPSMLEVEEEAAAPAVAATTIALVVVVVAAAAETAAAHFFRTAYGPLCRGINTGPA